MGPRLLAAACLLVAGCAAQPFEYRGADEMREGPGLFTGPDGAIVVRGWKRERDSAGPAASQ